VPVDLNQHDVFLLRQRFQLAINRYEFFLSGPDPATPGELLCFVEQKRFKFKEDIRFYVDDSKQQELLAIKARQAFDPRATYDVTDGSGRKIGELQKVFGQSLLRSTYRLSDARGEEVAIVTEKSMGIAIFRRLADFVPYVGDFLPIPYHFVFKRGEQILGEHRRQMFKLRDMYAIDMTADPERTVDRRLVLAIAVALDALQAR
jgi:uncharacterized protein YxjI